MQFQLHTHLVSYCNILGDGLKSEPEVRTGHLTTFTIAY